MAQATKRWQGMSEAEARLAAATFEFPPFRATATQYPGVDGWVLDVDDGTGNKRAFLSVEDWLSTWERVSRVMVERRAREQEERDE